VAIARDIITAALKDLGVLAAGEVATAYDADDGLISMNRLIDQYKAERLMIFTETRTTFTIVSGTATYTVGTTGTVAVARPVFLRAVNYLDSSDSVEVPLTPLTEDGFVALADKTAESEQPTHFYYNPTYPLGALRLWPEPQASTLSGVLYAPAAVAGFAAITTSVSLPPGYERMLQKNLAVELAPTYGRKPNEQLVAAAMESKAVVKRANKRLADLSHEFLGSGGGGYNILHG
jgi:hypothetical protein